jgi:8-hydroxy-5-deazaflavin:NADPH oxidoreductase
MNITIIGTGNMGRGIGTRLVAGGHSVTLIDQNLESAQNLAKDLRKVHEGANVQVGNLGQSIKDEIVVLAVWYPISLELAKTYAHQLAGKIVVDIANPLNSTFDGLATQPGSSAAEELAALLPEGTKVVKAFNTTFAGTLVAGQVAGQTLDVLIAGDDEYANNIVAALVQDGGLTPVKVGGLQKARQLEGLGFIGITIQGPLGYGFGSAWRLVSPA